MIDWGYIWYFFITAIKALCGFVLAAVCLSAVIVTIVNVCGKMGNGEL